MTIIMLEYNVQIKLCDLILNIEKVNFKKKFVSLKLNNLYVVTILL